MPPKMGRLLKNLRVRVKSVGVNVLGLSVNFELKVKKKPRTTRLRKGQRVEAKQSTLTVTQAPRNILLDTLHEIADKERKLALRERDWESAFLAALAQGWLAQQKKQTETTG